MEDHYVLLSAGLAGPACLYIYTSVVLGKGFRKSWETAQRSTKGRYMSLARKNCPGQISCISPLTGKTRLMRREGKSPQYRTESGTIPYSSCPRSKQTYIRSIRRIVPTSASSQRWARHAPLTGRMKGSATVLPPSCAREAAAANSIGTMPSFSRCRLRMLSETTVC